MASESQLYLLCQKSHKLDDIENYILTYPSGEHSPLVVSWWGQVIDEELHSEKNNIKKIELTHQYLNKADRFLNMAEDSTANVWNNIISSLQEQCASSKRIVLEQIKQLKGRVACEELLGKIKEAQLTKEELDSIGFSHDVLNYMENEFKGLKSLDSEALEEGKDYPLPLGNTEIYFWGVPRSGKTCCLGAMLSQSRNLGYYESFDGKLGADYFQVLSNVFHPNRLCRLLKSTSETAIAYASYTFNHKKKFGRRQCCLIDLAGETFKAIREREHGKEEQLDDARKLCLKVATSFLKDTRNRKLHFFVVPYLEDPTEPIPGTDVCMEDFLHDCMHYLEKEKVFTSSTDGIYIVVTKTDMMPNVTDADTDVERDQKAEDYVITNYPSLYNSLERVCKSNNINGLVKKPLKVLAFSIGDLVTSDICRFDPKGGNRLIDIICDKSKKKSSWWGSIFN